MFLPFCVAVKNVNEPVHGSTREPVTTPADTFRSPSLELGLTSNKCLICIRLGRCLPFTLTNTLGHRLETAPDSVRRIILAYYIRPPPSVKCFLPQNAPKYPCPPDCARSNWGAYSAFPGTRAGLGEGQQRG